MAEKATTMNLKVDLQCEKCYKKVKKVLGKFPQITEQLYDEKKNIVRVTVVCCSPEKIRDKLCCKGGGSIRSIEIVEPPKPAPPKKPEDKKKDEPKGKTTKPQPPKDEPPTTGGAAYPPPVGPAWVFPEPMPVSVLAYPAPAQQVGLFYYGGPGGPTGFYGRPIYDSYGGGGPSYVRSHDQNAWEEEESGCTIT